MLEIPGTSIDLLAQAQSLDDLFLHFLQDVYYAERQLLKALPKMAKNAQVPTLKEAFTAHREETVHQIERLEAVFERPTSCSTTSR